MMDTPKRDRWIWWFLGALAVFGIVFAVLWVPAHAHTLWANGEEVPPWVKRACCGPADVHHLRADQVHAMPDGFHVDGLSVVIPYKQAQPAPDGEYWGFWAPTSVGYPINVYCFFAPIGSI